MQITEIERRGRAFVATWTDQSVTEFPFIWLRDNDPTELHPHTRERIFDLTSVSLDIQPTAYDLVDDALVVHWEDKQSPSVYASLWLRSHRPGVVRPDPCRVPKVHWSVATIADIPHFDALQCSRSPRVLQSALVTIKRMGLIIIDGLEDEAGAGEHFAELIGFKRETNFGVMFEVISKPDPNNLAYTSIALPLHTDLPNQNLVPGYQFLHSFRNNASGGESVFADGFSICADFEKDRPDEFDLLKRVAVPWRFHDDSFDIRYRRPIINQHANGEFDCLVFNAHLADVTDLETGLIYDFYAAYQRFMMYIRDPKYRFHHALKPGQMVMFDNQRVLHGRAEFDPSSGERHYRGFYIDYNEVDSMIRVLSRDPQINP